MKKVDIYLRLLRFTATLLLFSSFFSCAERAWEAAAERLNHLQLEPIKSALYCVKGEAVSISDGDTFSLKVAASDSNLKNINDTIIRIRSFGIDAPEKDQPYGEEARIFLRHAIMGRKELLVYMTGEKTYGRYVGIVFVDGKDINYETLKGGFAWVYSNAKKIKHYVSAEREAKHSMIGLWRGPEPVKPWLWRKMTDEEKETYKKKYGYD